MLDRTYLIGINVIYYFIKCKLLPMNDIFFDSLTHSRLSRSVQVQYIFTIHELIRLLWLSIRLNDKISRYKTKFFQLLEDKGRACYPIALLKPLLLTTLPTHFASAYKNSFSCRPNINKNKFEFIMNDQALWKLLKVSNQVIKGSLGIASQTDKQNQLKIVS